jgi:hypothetical protein
MKACRRKADSGQAPAARRTAQPSNLCAPLLMMLVVGVLLLLVGLGMLLQYHNWPSLHHSLNCHRCRR